MFRPVAYQCDIATVEPVSLAVYDPFGADLYFKLACAYRAGARLGAFATLLVSANAVLIRAAWWLSAGALLRMAIFANGSALPFTTNDA